MGVPMALAGGCLWPIFAAVCGGGRPWSAGSISQCKPGESIQAVGWCIDQRGSVRAGCGRCGGSSGGESGEGEEEKEEEEEEKEEEEEEEEDDDDDVDDDDDDDDEELDDKVEEGTEDDADDAFFSIRLSFAWALALAFSVDMTLAWSFAHSSLSALTFAMRSASCFFLQRGSTGRLMAIHAFRVQASEAMTM